MIAKLEDCVAAMATVSAFYPGRFPIETQQVWAGKLERARILVEDLVLAVDDLASRTKRPTFQHLEEALVDARAVRLRREEYVGTDRQLEPPKPMTDQEREAAMLCSRILFVETRRAIANDDGPVREDRWHQLTQIPLDELRVLAASAAQEIDLMDSRRLVPRVKGLRARPHNIKHVSQVATASIAGNTAPRQACSTEDLDPRDPDEEDVLF